MTVMIVAIVAAWLLLVLILFFTGHGIDRIKHPEEWKDAGSSGERIVYKTLIEKFHIPEGQIFRNVYVPTHASTYVSTHASTYVPTRVSTYVPANTGKTSEIDLVVVSKKGLFVFECKNYGGNIYGDAKRKKWIQYIGREKHYFYSPLLQNRGHAKHLREFLAKDGIEVPIIPVIATITRGNWKVRNLGEEDYVLGVNCRLKDIYAGLPDCEAVRENFRMVLARLGAISRPGEEVRRRHVEGVGRMQRGG